MNQPKFNESPQRRGKRYNKTLGANAINSKISGSIYRLLTEIFSFLDGFLRNDIFRDAVQKLFTIIHVLPYLPEDLVYLLLCLKQT